MRLISTFLKILSIDSTPALELAPPPEPLSGSVRAEDLLNLAAVMRDLWMPDAGFAGEGHKARSIVLAALLRLFPDRTEPAVVECLQRHRPAGYCDACPADTREAMRDLDQYLDGIERPNLTLPASLAVIAHVRAELDAAERRLRLDDIREQAHR